MDDKVILKNRKKKTAKISETLIEENNFQSQIIRKINVRAQTIKHYIFTYILNKVRHHISLLKI